MCKQMSRNWKPESARQRLRSRSCHRPSQARVKSRGRVPHISQHEPTDVPYVSEANVGSSPILFRIRKFSPPLVSFAQNLGYARSVIVHGSSLDSSFPRSRPPATYFPSTRFTSSARSFVWSALAKAALRGNCKSSAVISSNCALTSTAASFSTCPPCFLSSVRKCQW
jgi:hypothetical protein